ncbi:MAG: hypothetical protein EBT04_14460, partial [Betaproteobacteria bacterium]|nr:hypothetical protein [Betaproteobacteria bacterium]
IGLDDVQRWRRPVASRAGENLFWLGRYSERAELATRLVRLGLSLSDSVEATPVALRRAIVRIALELGLMDAPPTTEGLVGSAQPAARNRAAPLQDAVAPLAPVLDVVSGSVPSATQPVPDIPIGQIASALILAMRIGSRPIVPRPIAPPNSAGGVRGTLHCARQWSASKPC